MSTKSDKMKDIREDKEGDSENEEPVICSKCNVVFETDEKYLRHYDKVHNQKSGIDPKLE